MAGAPNGLAGVTAGRRKRLKYCYTNVENWLELRRYWTTAYRACTIKSRCTTGSPDHSVMIVMEIAPSRRRMAIC
jgi:hypothetical protein